MPLIPPGLLVLLLAAVLGGAAPAWGQLPRPEKAGHVVSWGGFALPMAPLGTKYPAIAAGSHTVALTTDGAVMAWGRNYEGQATTPAAARQGVARFEAERQALAMMDHPNIAKMLDAGTTGDAATRLPAPLMRI